MEIVFALSERGETVAVAESLTGGLLTAALVRIPGASVVLRGGVVAYATELKHQLLGVDAALLARVGPVDPGVAGQMAAGVRDRLGSTWGVSTTGVAGPGPADGIPAGRAYLAVAGPGVAQVQRLDLDGGRDVVRNGCVRQALELLAFALGAAPEALPSEQGDPAGR